jgi:hypothetical protein
MVSTNTTRIECPIDFYNNCKNALRKCQVCSAGYGDTKSKFFYAPIEDIGIGSHPYIEVIDRAKAEEINNKRTEKLRKRKTEQSKYTRKGLDQEKRDTQAVIKQTKRSGALYGDGDHSILNGLITNDSKRRFKTSSFSLSWDEYTSARNKCSQWMITVDGKDGQEHTVVIMTMDAYGLLLALASRDSIPKESE